MRLMKNGLKLLLVFGVMIGLFGFAGAGVEAKEGREVDHVAGVLAKLVEKVTLYTKLGKPAKARYMERLLDKRLAELAYVVENDRDAIEPSASRYSSYIGNLTNYMVKNNLTGEKEGALALYAEHHEVLLKLRDNFEWDSGWWLAIQHAVNNTDWLVNDIKKI